MIFSRNRGKAGRPDAEADAETLEPDEVDSGAAKADGPTAGSGFGPYDAGTAPKDGTERIDFGSLQIPAVPGVEIRFQTSAQGEIGGLVLVHEQSQLQLAAYAAPRTEGIWDEIRDMIRTNLTSSGARPEEVTGDYGRELRARVRDEAGATTIVRHVGVDGPRWFLHAVYAGAAGADPEAAGPLREVLRGLVVARGNDARPVQEGLPMRMPPQAVQQMEAAAGGQPLGQANGTPARGANGSSAGRTPTRKKA